MLKGSLSKYFAEIRIKTKVIRAQKLVNWSFLAMISAFLKWFSFSYHPSCRAIWWSGSPRCASEPGWSAPCTHCSSWHRTGTHRCTPSASPRAACTGTCCRSHRCNRWWASWDIARWRSQTCASGSRTFWLWCQWMCSEEQRGLVWLALCHRRPLGTTSVCLRRDSAGSYLWI